MSFGEWIYDDNIRQIEKADPDKIRHKYMLREVERRNDELKDRHSQAKLAKSTSSGRGRGRGKAKGTRMGRVSQQWRTINQCRSS